VSCVKAEVNRLYGIVHYSAHSTHRDQLVRRIVISQSTSS
jgi:hypothetical protein